MFIFVEIIVILMLFCRVNAQCTLTAPATEGPYYYPGAPRVNSSVCPQTSTLIDGCYSANANGRILIIRGQVLDATDCRTPLPSRLDIWQANALGQYSERPRYDCRGTIDTDNQGRFTFRTVFPGWYRMDNTANSYRPAHIHFKITPTNPYLWPRDACGLEWCNSNQPSLIISVDQSRDLNTFESQWNIYMMKGGNGFIPN